MRKDVGPVLTVWNVCRWSGLGQGENDIIFGLNMSGEMHMRKQYEVFGCIPHGRGALSIRHLPDGAAGLLECDSFNRQRRLT